MWAIIAYVRVSMGYTSGTAMPVSRLRNDVFISKYVNHYLVPINLANRALEQNVMGSGQGWLKVRTWGLKRANARHLVDVWRDGNRAHVMLAEFAKFESCITKRMMGKGYDDRVSEADVEEALSNYETLTGRELDPTQRTAVTNAILHRNSVIIGRPGYGKSSCISAICNVAAQLNLVGDSPVLLALAGKACQRLRDEFVGTDSLPYRGLCLQQAVLCR
jgi:hypothetical protein